MPHEAVVTILYPFSQFYEINISLLSLQKLPNTAPNLFERGLEYGKYVVIANNITTANSNSNSNTSSTSSTSNTSDTSNNSTSNNDSNNDNNSDTNNSNGPGVYIYIYI